MEQSLLGKYYIAVYWFQQMFEVTFFAFPDVDKSDRKLVLLFKIIEDYLNLSFTFLAIWHYGSDFATISLFVKWFVEMNKITKLKWTI